MIAHLNWRYTCRLQSNEGLFLSGFTAREINILLVNTIHSPESFGFRRESALFPASALLPLELEAANRCPRTSWENEPEPRKIFNEVFSLFDLLVWHIGRCRGSILTTESNMHCNFIISLYSKCVFAVQLNQLWTHIQHRLPFFWI